MLRKHQEAELTILDRKHAELPLELTFKQDRIKQQSKARFKHTAEVLRHAKVLSSRNPVKLQRPRPPVVKERQSLTSRNGAMSRGSALLEISKVQYKKGDSDLTHLHNFDKVSTAIHTLDYKDHVFVYLPAICSRACL